MSLSLPFEVKEVRLIHLFICTPAGRLANPTLLQAATSPRDRKVTEGAASRPWGLVKEITLHRDHYLRGKNETVKDDFRIWGNAYVVTEVGGRTAHSGGFRNLDTHSPV